MRADSTRPSSAAVIAPADGPKSSAAAMLKVSEIEKLIGIAGNAQRGPAAGDGQRDQNEPFQAHRMPDQVRNRVHAHGDAAQNDGEHVGPGGSAERSEGMFHRSDAG